MIIKENDGVYQDIERLQALLNHPNADTRSKILIEEQIRKLKAGERGESNALYHIKTYFGMSENWIVLNDLRLEVDGMVAQIDHLLISRLLDFWVCESKHVRNGVRINEHGEFTTYDYQRRPCGMASPIEQNERHIRVLRKVFEAGHVKMPTRLGMTLKPRFRSAVLISHGAISRPKTTVPGLESVMKTENLERYIRSTSENGNPLDIAKLVAQATIADIGQQLVKLHRPIAFDWERRMRLGDVTPPPSEDRAELAVVMPTKPIDTSDTVSTSEKRPARKVRPLAACEACGDPISSGVKSYCVKNPEKFANKIYCMPCQAKLGMS